MNKNIKYNINLYVNKEEMSDSEIIERFNQKLLKVILTLEEKSNYCQE